MSKPRVYVETTIPSFYHETRTAPEIVVRRRWTRQWWNDALDRYELVTSPPVLDELAGGPRERVAARIALVRELPLLAIEPGIAEIVQAYIRHKLMPVDPAGERYISRSPRITSAISW
jgi:transposase-like protein